MPVNVPDGLPAVETLRREGIFVMTRSLATQQDIRPLRVIIFNLMPTKIATETQLLRVLGNSPLQLDITFLRTATHISRNTPPEHLEAFYQTFDDIRANRYDGMLITGAPVEQLDFEGVTYWDELTAIMRWADEHVFSTFFICWAAQAALFYHYGVPKHPLRQKCSGVYRHNVLVPACPLLRGFDDAFMAPHSRHTEVRAADIEKIDGLQLLASSREAGVYLAATPDLRRVFSTGHSEYDPDTLKTEYLRDIGKGLDVPVPAHYFPADDPTRPPDVSWRAHANLLFSNWLNYAVYQETPFDWC